MANFIQKIKTYFLMMIAINLISLQKALLVLNKKKNKKGFLFNITCYISNISNVCLAIALKESETLLNKKYGN
jgi:hypothetical protein